MVVLGITEQRLHDRGAAHPSAATPVLAPPIQLPPVLDSLFNLIEAAPAAQPEVAQANPCQIGVAIASSGFPGEGQVGDGVTFTFTVTNDGDVPLTDVQVDSDLPSGLELIASSYGGTVDPDTGYAGWALGDGLAMGESTTLSVTATIAEPGIWTTDVCVAAQDALGSEVDDCASTTVVSGTPTPTPTPSPTATLTPTASVTTTATAVRTSSPTVTPTPAQTSTPTPVATSTLPPTPTRTPQATATHAATATPQPAPTSTPTSSLQPTVTPSPTSTPSPVVTISPTVTVQPETPTPTSTLQPTVTASPTGTPQPTATRQPSNTPGP
jgi:uncharacterized repeat protein (TIGR01451 family)